MALATKATGRPTAYAHRRNAVQASTLDKARRLVALAAAFRAALAQQREREAEVLAVLQSERGRALIKSIVAEGER